MIEEFSLLWLDTLPPRSASCSLVLYLAQHDSHLNQCLVSNWKDSNKGPRGLVCPKSAKRAASGIRVINSRELMLRRLNIDVFGYFAGELFSSNTW